MNNSRWRKSSLSSDETACVEVLNTLDAVRDSKNPGPELPAPGLLALVRSLKSGKR
ncbi:DUF397 domain-containing protein [Actinokineospora sp.]|uniref:DUF397 domain-containing protein n=1 Tax=Actinokineospora sp. TaxID=1872133 RepID=UPI004037714D